MALLISQVLILMLFGSKVSLNASQLILILICEVIKLSVLGGCISNHTQAGICGGSRRKEAGSQERKQTTLNGASSSIETT